MSSSYYNKLTKQASILVYLLKPAIVMLHHTKYVINLYLNGVMVFNDTFNNISAISWRSDLLVEETGEPGENNRPAIGH
jgi:hypothetical protein